MAKINLVIPAKEEINDLISLIKVLVKKKFINKLIIVLDENNKTNFFKHKKVKIISKNKGYGSAIKEGFKKSKTKYTCIYNADGSFNIDDLPKMLRLTNKKIDFVFASRYLSNAGSNDDTILTYLGNFFFTKITKYLLNINLSDVLYTYVLCNTKKFLRLNLKSNDFRLCVELPFKVQILNYKYTSCPSFEYKRKYGKKKVNEFRDGLLILIEIIKCFIIKIQK